MDIQKKQPKYFEIIRALKKGGLSLWLNRRTLSSMMIVPVIVTFITLMMTRMDGANDLSPFMLALIQIPADFVTGIFCALIIVIIMNAPKKKDDGAPVVFALNIMEKKTVMITAAIAHVIFGYFSSGLYGVMQLVAEPMRVAAEAQESLPGDSLIILIGLLTIGFYIVRFMMLPILLIAEIDIKSFFKTHMSFSFSAPIFLVKFVSTTAVGLCVYIVMQGVLMGRETGDALTPIQGGLLDFATAIASVIATAWAYASLCVGLRQMIEKE